MGAKRKAPRGLTKAILIRCDQQMIDELDLLRARLIKTGVAAQSGVTLSRADVVRSILWKAINRASR